MSYAQILKRPDFANYGEAIDWEIRHGQVPYELSITLPETVWRALPEALSELAYTVRMARGTLDYLREAMIQNMNADHRMIALMELASLGLERVSEREAALIDEVEMIIRPVISQIPQSKPDRKGKEKPE